ncbi:hypothetical protein [Rhodocyclus tenuis]|uniref:Uncharacterized protein n=1 Tax=Rhodocyclus tenuis TaxID=1066 RepID=A0A840G8N9_RHOTE|nr:hypothetical protein [Rhodocyclus tenuis]MBB4247280.1 hypothetical protein [Rhodocyclus tenuis]
MSSLLSLQLQSLLTTKTLDEQIIDILRDASEPYSVRDIAVRLTHEVPNLCDEIRRLLHERRIERADDKDAPADMPRKTVATYLLPGRVVAFAPRAAAAEKRSAKPAPARKTVPVPTADRPAKLLGRIVDALAAAGPGGLTTKQLGDALPEYCRSSLYPMITAACRAGLAHRPRYGLVVAGPGADAPSQPRPATVDKLKKLLSTVVDALEEAKNGLLWYQDQFPDVVNDSDAEAMERIDSALEAGRRGG